MKRMIFAAALSLVSVTASASFFPSHFQLAHMGYQGQFKSQGIPGYASYCNEIGMERITSYQVAYAAASRYNLLPDEGEELPNQVPIDADQVTPEQNQTVNQVGQYQLQLRRISEIQLRHIHLLYTNNYLHHLQNQMDWLCRG
jgi:hypothetical protein